MTTHPTVDTLLKEETRAELTQRLDQAAAAILALAAKYDALADKYIELRAEAAEAKALPAAPTEEVIAAIQMAAPVRLSDADAIAIYAAIRSVLAPT